MFDFNGLTDFSYNTNFDTNVKIMVLSKKCLSKENNGKTFIHHTRRRATEDDTSVIYIGPQLRTKSDLTGKSFRWRASGQYNMIPENLRKTDKLAVFKNELNKWTWLNIPI